MARKLRVEYAGAIYHVMNRGDRREEIFKDDADRVRFLETLGEVCVKTGWQVQAWCLMGNHFHLVVETPRANLVAGMRWFLGTGTRYGATQGTGMEQGECGLEKVEAWLVLGVKEFSGGDAGIDGREARRPASWRRVEGIR